MDLIDRQEALKERIGIDGFQVVQVETLEGLPSIDAEEVIRCKDCKYFSLNKWGKVNDMPLIVAHEICDFWGEGCKTDKDGYCSFAERRE